MSLLALIPARGGSKEIPGKNIKEFCGKPLIAWAIEAAQKASGIDRIVLSTEDHEIAEVAQKWGAEVPFMRPAELAGDDTPGIEPVLHALEQLPTFDEVLLLQPTSPLRTAEDIGGILDLANAKKPPAVVSVVPAQKHPCWMYRMTHNQNLIPLIEGTFTAPRQDLEPAYTINGALYWAKTKWLQENKTFFSNLTLGYSMPVKRSIDLDSVLDWEWAKFLVKQGNV